MRNRKINVQQGRVKHFLKAGKPCNYIAKKLSYPVSVVYRIRDGFDVPYFIRKPKCEHRKQREGKCTHCKIRDIEDGFRYLCEYCWKYADSGAVYPETSFSYRAMRD